MTILLISNLVGVVLTALLQVPFSQISSFAQITAEQSLRGTTAAKVAVIANNPTKSIMVF